MKRVLFLALIFPIFCSAQSATNLDLKNGFLQFHLGDSVSLYKNYIYIAYAKHPDVNEVKPNALTLHKYLDRVTLINENGIITEIDVMIRDEHSIEYIDQLMVKAYGPGHEIPNDSKYDPGTHLVCTTWAGSNVTVMMIQNNINRVVNGNITRSRFQTIVFKRTGENKIEGALPADFPL